MATKRKVFYSFHYDNDVFRVQQIRNMGAIEGDEPVSKNDWETLQKGGSKAIEKWIEDNMSGKSCVVVLVGEDTYKRPWVIHEITKAWNDGKGLVGIYIHNLKDPKTGTCSKGTNPFEQIGLRNGKKLSDYVKCVNPKSTDAYNDIKANLADWVEDAINSRK
ncbi:TIR domain-containing protein (plasmid) [Leptospira sp. WS60.C2]